MTQPCIRCDNAPAVDQQGLCGHCHWAVEAEIKKLSFDLDRMAEFDSYCATRDKKKGRQK